MGQGETEEVIIESEFPISAKEIAEALETTTTAIFKHLKKLIIREDVKYVDLEKELSKKYFNCNKKVRLYYVGRLKKRKFD